jgi:hypothetical protein
VSNPEREKTMFTEIWRESFLAKKVRRFWSLAAGLGAMMIVAGVLRFVPIMQASTIPPPPPLWPRITSPLDKPLIMPSPPKRLVYFIQGGTVKGVIPAHVYYRPRSL